MGTGPAFDEIMGTRRVDAPPRAELAALGEWIDDTDPTPNCDRRQQSAEATFRQLGITFAVYGDEDAAERIIPFDIVPRIFLHDEWARLSEGLVQRVEAINAFLDDIYGERTILDGGHPPRRPDLRQRAVPPRDRRHPPAARRLGAYLRDRSGAHRARRFLRAGGQCAHAVGRQLHARKSRGDAAAVPRTVPRVPRRGGRQLSRPAARDDEVGRAARHGQRTRSASC